MSNINSEILLNKYNKVRIKTIELIDSLETEDMVVQTEKFVSPIKWHLAHTTWFFENAILKASLSGYKVFDKNFNFIFNSYYNSLGKYNPSYKRGFLNRPTLRNIIDYRNYIDDQINLFFLKKVKDKHKFVLELGINHEQQHQELIMMDILNIFFNNPLKPNYCKKKKLKDSLGRIFKDNWQTFNSNTYQYGSEADSFCYDNELPIGQIQINPFKLNSQLVTNREWREFIHEDGYNRPEFWFSDGWDYIKKNSISRPMYWLDDNYYFTLSGVSKILNNQPVSHISFYEADAFCRYKNKRLPTEFELELALKKNIKRGNFLDNKIFEPSLIQSEKSSSFYGDLWNWTNSNYVPYKDYKPFKGIFSEYNGKFMCNQFVLKGGSCVTPKEHLRASYRNFYYPGDRWQFSGLRLASDLN